MYGLVKVNNVTIITRDGRKLGCPFGTAEDNCGDWCVHFEQTKPFGSGQIRVTLTCTNSTKMIAIS